MALSLLRCGNCGKSHVRLYVPQGEQVEHISQLVAKCLKCKSKTVFKIPTPKIAGDWGKGSNGILCVFRNGK